MRECPFEGCGRHISDKLFACPKHWYSIPANLRPAIYKAYDDYLADRIGLEELRQIQQEVLDAVQGTKP